MSNAFRILSLLVAAVVMSTVACAQAVVTFAPSTGNATATSNRLPVPASGATNSSRSATIYLPADLGGLPSGALITSIEFFKSDSLGTADVNNVHSQVWLKNSAKTAYVAADANWTSLTNLAVQVAGGSSTYLPPKAGWVPIGVFNTPFVYTGGSLEVMVEWSHWHSFPSPIGAPAGALEWVRWNASTIRSVAGAGTGGFGTSPTYSNLNVSAAYQFQVPHLRVTYVDQNGAYLQLNDAPVGGYPVAGTSNIEIMLLNAVSRGVAQDLSTMVVTKTGGLPDSDIASVTLWHDVNRNGRVDPGTDTSLSSSGITSGSATLSGINLNIPAGETRALIVAASLAASSAGGTFELQVAGSGVTFTPGADMTSAYPLTSNTFTLLAKVSSFPYVEGLDTPGGSNNNIRFVNVQEQGPYGNPNFQGGQVPPGVAALGGFAPFSIVASQGSNTPQAGAGFASAAHQTGSAGTSFAAAELYFDMSQFTLADWIELSFYWADSGIVPSVSSTFRPAGVFLSTDGGATWQAILHLFQFGTQNTWQQEVLALTPLMQQLSLTFTADMVIRIQNTSNADNSFFMLDSIRVEKPAPRLDLTGGPVGTGVPSAKPRQLVGAIDLNPINSAATVDDLTLTMNGTAAFSDVTDIELWVDDGNGVFEPSVDAPVGTLLAALNGSGEAVFNGPGLISLAQGQRRLLWVSAEIDAGVALGSTVGFAIQMAASINCTPGPNGAFPVSAGTTRAVGFVTTLPWDQDFPGSAFGALPDNSLEATFPGSYPSAAQAGGLVGSHQSAGTARLRIASAPTFANIQTIGDALGIDYPTGDATGALDFYFDLSAYSTATDDIGLSFRWMHCRDEESSEDGVFLSTDGGATWLAALYKFDFQSITPSTSATWGNPTINLSSVLQASGSNFTSRMVIRFQGRGTHIFNTPTGPATTRDGLLIDDIELGETAARLDVSPNIGVVGTGARAGRSGVVIGAFDFVPFSSDHGINSVLINNIGTLPDNMLSDVELWSDTNGNNRLDAGDTPLGTATIFSGGVASFSGAPMVTLAKSREPVRIFVAADIVAAAQVGDTIQLSIDVDSNVDSSAGPAVGSFPVEGLTATIVQAASLPYFTGFETLPVDNLTTVSRAGHYPAASNTGGPVDLFSTSHDGNVALGSPATAHSPASGASMAGIDFAGIAQSAAAGALDFHLDLSAFTAVNDAVILSFAWNSVGNQQQDGDHVLLSVDGGHSWHSVYRIPVSTSLGVWTTFTGNLSAVLTAAGTDFTQDVVLRIQSTGALTFDNDGLLLDDIAVNALPRMRLETSAGATVNAGNVLNVGGVSTGSPLSAVFNVFNTSPTGADALELTANPAVQASSIINAQVTLATSPATTIAPGSDTTFTLEVTPVARGAFFIEVEIPTNDPAAGIFRFFISGNGLEPEIDIQRPAGTSIADGGVDALGGLASGVTHDLQYIIVNGGNTDLNLTGTPAVSVVGTPVNCTAVVFTQPTVTQLGLAAASPFTIRVTPGLGAFSFVLNVPNDDPSEGNYTINVQGNGTTTPEIDVKDDQGADVLSGSFHVVASTASGTAMTLTFTIENNGNSPLNLLGTPAVEIISQNNVTASVTLMPAVSIAVGSSETFTIQATPSAGGNFSFVVQILNDDVNESLYRFTVVGATSTVTGGGGGGDSGGCSTNGKSTLWYLALLLAIPAVMVFGRKIHAGN